MTHHPPSDAEVEAAVKKLPDDASIFELYSERELIAALEAAAAVRAAAPVGEPTEQDIARLICRKITRDCVMDTDGARPICTDENCLIIRIVEDALEHAASRCDEPYTRSSPSPRQVPGTASEAAGWKLVPVEPTNEMGNAAVGLLLYGATIEYQVDGSRLKTVPHYHSLEHQEAVNVYRAMLSASPAPPAPAQSKELEKVVEASRNLLSELEEAILNSDFVEPIAAFSNSIVKLRTTLSALGDGK